MKGPATETVGEIFRTDLLRAARDRTADVIAQVARQIRPGMTEGDVKTLLQSVQEELGAPKSWHPPQIRFGENTLKAFGEKGQENVPLKATDIFFLDIGPIFEGHEGDVGRTFSIGDDPEMQRCCTDIEAIWNDVRDHWSKTNTTGEKLYQFATECAAKRGWKLTTEHANGHRIADFPHTVRNRGSIESFDGHPAPDRWILEIQIRHPSRPFGAFYEDLLN
jgi:Xaa-Pro aminopeptidase